MRVVKDMAALQEALLGSAGQGRRIGLVPTMGALHEGHLTLVRIAKQLCDDVVVSIFVNPAQFGPDEDFERYPRSLDIDLQLLEKEGAFLAYVPTVDDVYPLNFTAMISMGELGEMLCGQFRPGFFDGVATVIIKLFNRVLPMVAVFGEKDYQQLCVIRRLCFDLDLPIEIVGVPIVREPDGLAMSSRNRYLNPIERALASQLYKTLCEMALRLTQNIMTIDQAVDFGKKQLASVGISRIDYLEVRQSYTLEPLETYASPARLLAAVWIGDTRLIDNLPLGEYLPPGEDQLDKPASQKA